MIAADDQWQWDVHDQSPEFDKLTTLQWLSKEIANHLICGAVLNANLLLIDSIGDKIISDIEVTGSTPTGVLTILFKQDSALVVLVYNVVGDVEPLFNEKIMCPNNDGHRVINANELSLGGTSGVDLLSCGAGVHGPLS